MSLRYEQYMALLKTRNFLRDLLSIDEYPKTKKEMRERAYRCIKHYPFLQDSGKPIFSEDDFTKD
jgi:hypothetical protein